MATLTKIAWTDRVWNPVLGCDKISTGCKFCWAKALWDMRHKAYMEGKKVPKQYANPFETVTLHPERLWLPNWKTPQKVFVNSMSDLFHNDVTDKFIQEVYSAIASHRAHVFQILTKRPKRMKDFHQFAFNYVKNRNVLNPIRTWIDESMPNLWLGVSAENQQTADERIPILLDTPAAVRWVSVEPMLEAINLNESIPCVDCDGVGYLEKYGKKYACESCGGWEERAGHGISSGLHWVVVGCESGKNRRPCKIEWIESIVDQCQMAGVPVFVKQIELNGKVIKDLDQFPEHLRVREFPR